MSMMENPNLMDAANFGGPQSPIGEYIMINYECDGDCGGDCDGDGNGLVIMMVMVMVMVMDW